MYLKFEYDGKDKFLKFEEGRVTVGRGSSADIIIRAEGVSRLHLELQRNSDGFFVQDLGSTNGTFINDVRLEANKSTEFHSFFPINMGGNVTISLVEQEDDSDNTDDIGTNPTHKSISQSDHTGEFQLSTGRYVRKKKKRADLSWLKPLIPSILLFIGFITLTVFYVWFKGQEKSQVVQSEIPKAEVKVEKPVVDPALVSRTNIYETIKKIEPTLKCQTDWVQEICKEFSINRPPARLEGIILVKDALFFMIDTKQVKKYIEENRPLSLKDKNLFVNRFEGLYPEGKIEEFQLKYNYHLYQDSDELVDRVLMLYDFLKLKKMTMEFLKTKVKSVVFIEPSPSLSLAYRNIEKPYFIFNSLDEIEPFLKKREQSLEGIYDILYSNDPRVLEEINPNYFRGVKNYRELIPELMSSESLKKLNQR